MAADLWRLQRERIWDHRINKTQKSSYFSNELYIPCSTSCSMFTLLYKQSYCLPNKSHLLPSTFSTDPAHTPLLGKGTDPPVAATLWRDAGISGLLGRRFLISSCFILSFCRRSLLAWRSLLRCSNSILWMCFPVKPEKGEPREWKH